MPKLCCIIVTALLLMSCTPPDAASNRQVTQRLIDETSRVFSRQHVAQWQDAFTWTFEEAGDLEDWTHQGFDLRSDIVDGAWRLGASRHGAFIERRVSLDAADLDRLVVTFKGTRKRPLQLQWAGPGESMAQPRVLEVRGKDDAGRYVFDLASHPHWRGSIQRLRWVPRMPSKLRGHLVSMRGQHSAAAPDRRRQASRQTFKVALSQTSRSARVVLPDTPWQEVLDVTDGDRLHGAWGIDTELPGAVAFHLDGTAEDGTSTRLATAVIGRTEIPDGKDTRGLAAGRWYPVDVDLSPWAGQRLELRLQVESAEPSLATAEAYGFWGDVKVSRPHTEPPPPNVVLVVIDTLRADHLSHYGYPRETSPRLERWAQANAVSFRSVVAAAPWTYPSHLSLFTGLDPLSHGQHHPRPLPSRFELLAQHMQDAGYETLAVTAGGYLDTHYGFARGFDRYTVVPGHLGAKGDLERGIEHALHGTRQARRPYFLFLHTYEVHTPHRVRQPYHRRLSGHDGDPERLARLTTQTLPVGDTAGAVRRKTYAWKDGQGGIETMADGELQQVIDAYDSAIAYADHHVMELLDELQERDGKPLVIITSDHGEALGEHELADHAYLYDFNLQIPLLMAFPDGRGAGQWVEEQVRQIDIMPTLLEALQRPLPAMDGTSLLPLLEGRSLDAEHAMAWSATAYQGLSLRRGNRLKYVFNPTLWQREVARDALFLLDRDPGEGTNRIHMHDAADELERLAIGRYMEHFEGLLVSFQPGATEEVEVRFTGPHWLGPQFFKSVDAPPDSLSLEERRRLKARVQPGDRFSVVLEQLTPDATLHIDITRRDQTCRLELPSTATSDSATATSEVLSRVFDASCSTVPSGLQGDGDGFAMSLLYRNAQAPGDPGRSDELPDEVADQLRALGYID